MTSQVEELRSRVAAAGQGHVFRFWEELDEASRFRLLAQLESLDLDLVARLAGLLGGDGETAPPRSLEPPELFPLERGGDDERRAQEAARSGRRLLAAGKVGYVLVAGGQASRLGFAGPKGAYAIGPVSDRTLFDYHAQRLRAARIRHGAPTPWYVMTSAANDADTRRFFEQRDFFGLPPGDVAFFQQDMLPALDAEGRILMASKDSIFLAPNGHGGALLGLARSGALEDMGRRGIEHISYFQVDNPLARPADPLFVGLHVLEGAGMSSKAVKKRDASEKVGVLGRIDGRMGCIEYSDLPEELRERRDADGELAFRAGNIAVHLIDVDFAVELTRGGFDLPWHLARKKMRVVDEEGAPTEGLGWKFETFVFDALSRSERSVTLEVDRALEFSPVKNAEGVDSPRTCRRDLCRLFSRWAAESGRALPGVNADGVHPVEIDPLVAEDQGEFLARTDLQPRVTSDGHLYG